MAVGQETRAFRIATPYGPIVETCLRPVRPLPAEMFQSSLPLSHWLEISRRQKAEDDARNAPIHLSMSHNNLLYLEQLEESNKQLEARSKLNQSSCKSSQVVVVVG